jgi:Zn-finger nucleic acid-binding protein
MVRCPVCRSARVVVVLSMSRKAYCVRCSSKWIQDGTVQHSIQPGVPAAPASAVPGLITR